MLEVLAVIAGIALLTTLIWCVRRRRSGLTIAPYDEIKRLIRSGKAAAPAGGFPNPESKPLDEIFAIEDDHAFFGALLDHIHEKQFGPGPEPTPLEAAIEAAFMVGGEVNNGGFDQYFFNSAADDAQLALRTLEEAGCETSVDLLRRAMAAVGFNEASEDREARWEQMDEWPEHVRERLDELDSAYFRMDENPDDLLAAYARARRDGFAPVRGS